MMYDDDKNIIVSTAYCSAGLAPAVDILKDIKHFEKSMPPYPFAVASTRITNPACYKAVGIYIRF